jgi:hypothetical protein
MGENECLTKSFAFLVSDESSFVATSEIVVDGGQVQV